MCKRCIVKIEWFKIVLWWIGVDFAETRVKHDIFFVTEKTKVYYEMMTTYEKIIYNKKKNFNLKDFIICKYIF